MSNRSDTTRSPRDSTFSAVFALCVAAIGCVIVMMSVPRPAPLQLPTLQLDAQQAEAQCARDETLATRTLSKEARTVYEHLLDAGRRELTGALGGDPQWLEREQRAYESFVQLRADQQDALYAIATQRFLRALRERSDDDEARALIGKQREQLIEHGYLSAEGALLAPELTLRATYKVRLDMLLSQPMTARLTTIERLAYEGFRALEARKIPPEVQQQALLAFKRLAGSHADEALAIWNARSGKPEALVGFVRGSVQASRNMRLRNMAISALQEIEARDADLEL